MCTSSLTQIRNQPGIAGWGPSTSCAPAVHSQWEHCPPPPAPTQLCPQNSWVNGSIHGSQLSFSPETHGRISIYAAVSGKPWNGWGGWKISFSLQIYGKQILQFSSLAMLNITGHRSSFFNVQRTLIFFFFHKEGTAKTQETGKSATVIEYGFKGQFFLARPKNHLCKGWLAHSLHSELNINKDMFTVSTFLPGL